MNYHQLASRISNHGDVIDSIEYYSRRVTLYSVESEFYEIYYDQKTNEIERASLATHEDLQKYLNRIKLTL
jgi:hypothetical protein